MNCHQNNLDKSQKTNEWVLLTKRDKVGKFLLVDNWSVIIFRSIKRLPNNSNFAQAGQHNQQVDHDAVLYHILAFDCPSDQILDLGGAQLYFRVVPNQINIDL